MIAFLRLNRIKVYLYKYLFRPSIRSQCCTCSNNGSHRSDTCYSQGKDPRCIRLYLKHNIQIEFFILSCVITYKT